MDKYIIDNTEFCTDMHADWLFHNVLRVAGYIAMRDRLSERGGVWREVFPSHWSIRHCSLPPFFLFLLAPRNHFFFYLFFASELADHCVCVCVWYWHYSTMVADTANGSTIHPKTTDEPSGLHSEIIEELRRRLMNTVCTVEQKQNGDWQIKSTARISEGDMKRLTHSDWWLNRFLAAQNNDVDVTYAVILEAIRWRSTNEVESEWIVSIENEGNRYWCTTVQGDVREEIDIHTWRGSMGTTNM